jgi:diaminohydroxyphosphoribosylaminopyrimidine deaminase / 5-amino-6-(5-phosphoribosylamino)uracil reductase
VTDGALSLRYMRRALALAARGRGTTAPNPMVGAVVVRDNRIVGEGFTQPAGGAHAEVEALRHAGAAANGATVYVTLEPCAAHGRTPPCVDALVAAGVSRVVYAASDPNPQMRGGAEKLRDAGIDVVGDVMAQDAIDQNPAFFHRFASPRPFITLKLALTLDGAITDARRVGAAITGPAARREVHRQRGDHDAVAVGLGTVLADDPQLTVRGVSPRPPVPPARLVFDRHARLPLTSALVQTASQVPVIDVCGATADVGRVAELRDRGVEVIAGDGLAEQLGALRHRGLTSIYVEGGATFANALLAAELVDRLIIFRAPVLLGATAVRPLQAGPPVLVEHAARHRLVTHRRLGDDLMAIYDLSSNVYGSR